MKILVYGISGGIGGIENLVFNIISVLAKQDMQFDIITYYDQIDNEELYKSMGVHIYKMTSKRENPLKNRSEFKEFFKKHASEFDAVWCNLAELINIDILKLAKQYGIKRRIIHSHSTASTRGKLLTFLHKKNKRKIGSIATDFWACSEAAGRWFFSDDIINSERFHVIKNGIRTERFGFDPDLRKSVREELEIGDSLLLGHIARLDIQQKNTLFLLSVFNEILKTHSDAKLLIIGDGPDRTLIERQIKESGIETAVIMLGFRKDASRFLNAMDAFILPSPHEGLAIVLIEAQTNGLPCFASEGVPYESDITGLVNFINLEKPPEYWAKQILETLPAERISKEEEVMSAGYNITHSAAEIKQIIEN